jgi:hypothetical protein
METLILKYDKNNTLAAKTVKYILSLGVFTAETEQNGLDRSLAEIKEGKVYKAKSAKDLMSKIK